MQSIVSPQPAVEPQVQVEKPNPTPQDKKKEPTAKLASELIKLASNSWQLATQAHLIHFNFEGETFLSVHKFLKKEYERNTKAFDKFGEYVRTLDYLMPMCSKGMTGACKNFKHVDNYKGEQMLYTYHSNLEEFGFRCKACVNLAKKMEAYDIENYLAEAISESFTSSWMIKSLLR